MQKIKKSISQVSCPTFLEYEERIKKLTRSVNGRKIISKKVDDAIELIDIVNILSSCPRYEEFNDDCINCRFILNLRQEIARIIIEATEAAISESTHII